MTNGIEFHNITKRYGADASAPLAVKGISFAVKKGTLTTILGPSGCGVDLAKVKDPGRARCYTGGFAAHSQEVPAEVQSRQIGEVTKADFERQLAAILR